MVISSATSLIQTANIFSTLYVVNMAPYKPSAKLPKDSHLNMEKPSEMIYNIRDKNRKFRLACSQLVLMNNTIKEIEVRYQQALVNNSKCYRYVLRLKLCSLEGVRNQFYDYAYAKADELEQLQLQLYNKHGIMWDETLEQDTDDESEDDE